MQQIYKKVLRQILYVSLGYISIIPIQGSSPIVTNGSLKFGAQLGYEGGFRLVEEFVGYFPIELFIAYHFKTIDKGPRYPLFGFWGSRYESCALQIGLCYKSIHMTGMRNDIEPKANFLLYPKGRAIGFISFNLKTLSLPILLKNYIGTNRKFCIIHRVAPVLLISLYKKDWIAELANQPGQELLQKAIYSDNANVNDERSYDYTSSNHIKEREAFYNKWKKRKEKDQRTYLAFSDLFKSRIGLEFSIIGIEYETDGGFILNWNLCNVSLFLKRIIATSMFSIGYNFNKLIHCDKHKEEK